MSTFTTPTRSRKTSLGGTPTTVRTAASHAPPSPHYVTTRRHSLYGTEDRVIVDPGSRVWKIGFSGEARPRAVFRVQGRDGSPLWSLSPSTTTQEEEEEEQKELYNILQEELRKVFHRILLTDPKSRKVIIVEHPLLPIYIKEMLARILFENLLVPSVSFAPSGLLALVGVGRTTGIVVDCGHLETSVLPFYASRPLYPHIQTTPIAGMKLNSHLRALLLLFARYYPPPLTLQDRASAQAGGKPIRVPEEVLTDAVVEEIKTRCCYVGEPLSSEASRAIVPSRSSSPPPPSSDPPPSEGETNVEIEMEPTDPYIMSIDKMYRTQSKATELRIKINPPQDKGTGLATLVVPGWIRERAAEILFTDGDLDEETVVEVILRSLRKIPIDLRRQLASNILVTGGTATIPGFAARLSKQLKLTLASPHFAGGESRRRYDPHASIRLLQPFLSVINNPSEQASEGRTHRAPAFSPALLPWVGGSLSGALKVTSHETLREKWDEMISTLAAKGESPQAIKRRRPVIYDWIHPPLSIGAPVANIAHVRAAA